MRLTSFTVSNFRSITTAKKVPLDDYSVLIGANNEGKSNILHALALGMESIENFKNTVRRDKLGRIIGPLVSTQYTRTKYDWLRDFPVSKQGKSPPDAGTEILLEFRLSESEIVDFQAEVGSKLNGSLPISVLLNRTGSKITIPKQGKGGTALNSKTTKIADFVSRNLSFEYIPAVRTAENAEEVIRKLVVRELSFLESDPAYSAALTQIKQLQDPVLNSLSQAVSKTINGFLPSVKAVEIKLDTGVGSRYLRSSLDIEVDDGNKTLLDRKGDGVKSLVALALMRHASDASTEKGASIIAIEEPEAHLHSKAIHELRDVLINLSLNNQVILTSHSPLFVNPGSLASTIVVRESKAAVAKNVAEVRDVLGVRLSDNLQSARLVAVVEGSNDVRLLDAIIRRRFPRLIGCLECGDLVFDELAGASNLSYKVRTYRASATMVHCFLDNDDSGRRAIQRASEDGVIKISDYNLFQVNGLNESELEDVLNIRNYKDEFFAEFQVDPTIVPPGARGRKWSEAMRVKFQTQGKIWDEAVEMSVKHWLSNYATPRVDDLLVEARLSPIEAFARSLAHKLGVQF